MSHVFDTVQLEPAYRKVASLIAARIMDRTLRTGDALPPEVELASQLGVNRSTVREALRELESSGLVQRRRGTKRMVVARPTTGAVAHGVSRALALNDVTVDQLWEALMIVEPPAADLAARRRSAEDLEALRSAVARFADPDLDADGAVAAVAVFFQAVATAAGNPVLALAQAPIVTLLASSLKLLLDRVPQARARIRTAQQRLLTAIESRDATTARGWMDKHVRDFRRGFEIAGIQPDFRVSLAP